MALSFVTVKCPQCGANLSIEENRKEAFCSYCGTKVLLHNDNEHIYRTIDEAAIKQTEAEKAVRMRQLDLVEEKRRADEKEQSQKRKILLIMASVGIALVLIGRLLTNDALHGTGMLLLIGTGIAWRVYSKHKKERALNENGQPQISYAVVPTAVIDYEKKSYDAMEAVFRSAGFVNIQCVPLKDLSFGVIKKPDMVESITINGKTITSGGKKYPATTLVVISYHSARE